MKRTPFFKSSIMNIDEELAEIDLNAVVFHLDAPLPGEEVIGELNDFEKRAMIWPQLLLEEIKEVFKIIINDQNIIEDKSAVDRYVLELAGMKAKLNLLLAKTFASISERFDTGRQLGIRSNFKVVASKKTGEDIREELEKLGQAALAELNNCLNGHEIIA